MITKSSNNHEDSNNIFLCDCVNVTPTNVHRETCFATLADVVSMLLGIIGDDGDNVDAADVATGAFPVV